MIISAYFRAMKKTIVLAFILSAALYLLPAIAYADFDILSSPLMNIIDFSSARAVNNKLVINGNVNPVITVPGYGIRPERDRFLKITVKTSNPGSLMKIYWYAGGTRYSYPNSWISVGASNEAKTYTVDLAASPHWRGDIAQFFISFTGLNDTIEISDISIVAPKGAVSFIKNGLASFFQGIGITPKSVNNVPTPFLFGLNYPALLNYVLIAAGGLLLLYSALRRVGLKLSFMEGRRTIAWALPFVLIVALLHDARNVYDEYNTHRGISLGMEKSNGRTELYSLGKIHGFSEFLKQNAPSTIDTISVIPNDPRICPVQLKYWLYPIRLSSGAANNASAAGAVFEAPEYALSGGRLLQNGIPIGEADLLARFDENSFMYAPKDGLK